MVQQSKPWRANSSITEYSPWPGTLRSNTRDVTDEPWTKNSTGRDGSPGFGSPTRLRNIHKGISPFFAQYSLLHIWGADMPMTHSLLCAAVVSPSAPATRQRPAPLTMVRRASNGSRSLMISSGRVLCFVCGGDQLIRRRMRQEAILHCSARTGLLPAKTGLVSPPFDRGAVHREKNGKENCREQPADRCRTRRTDAVRIVRLPDADPDPDRFQRRILSGPA